MKVTFVVLSIALRICWAYQHPNNYDYDNFELISHAESYQPRATVDVIDYSAGCPRTHDPICATNGHEYLYFKNLCELEVRNYEELIQGRFEFTKCPLQLCHSGPQCETCPDIVDPICAVEITTHQMTEFKNLCEMKFTACSLKRNYRVESHGACAQSLECPSSCSKIFQPICARFHTETREFPNRCELEKSICQSNIKWTILHPGPCKTVNNDFDLYPQQPVCAVHRGKKKTFMNYSEMERGTILTGKNWILLHNGHCAARTSCSRSTTFRPVCAIHHLNVTTFYSPCHLQKENERTGKVWSILHFGVCGKVSKIDSGSGSVITPSTVITSSASGAVSEGTTANDTSGEEEGSGYENVGTNTPSAVVDTTTTSSTSSEDTSGGDVDITITTLSGYDSTTSSVIVNSTTADYGSESLTPSEMECDSSRNCCNCGHHRCSFGSKGSSANCCKQVGDTGSHGTGDNSGNGCNLINCGKYSVSSHSGSSSGHRGSDGNQGRTKGYGHHTGHNQDSESSLAQYNSAGQQIKGSDTSLARGDQSSKPYANKAKGINIVCSKCVAEGQHYVGRISLEAVSSSGHGGSSNHRHSLNGPTSAPGSNANAGQVSYRKKVYAETKLYSQDPGAQGSLVGERESLTDQSGSEKHAVTSFKCNCKGCSRNGSSSDFKGDSQHHGKIYVENRRDEGSGISGNYRRGSKLGKGKDSNEGSHNHDYTTKNSVNTEPPIPPSSSPSTYTVLSGNYPSGSNLGKGKDSNEGSHNHDYITNNSVSTEPPIPPSSSPSPSTYTDPENKSSNTKKSHRKEEIYNGDVYTAPVYDAPTYNFITLPNQLLSQSSIPYGILSFAQPNSPFGMSHLPISPLKHPTTTSKPLVSHAAEKSVTYYTSPTISPPLSSPTKPSNASPVYSPKPSQPQLQQQINHPLHYYAADKSLYYNATLAGLFLDSLRKNSENNFKKSYTPTPAPSQNPYTVVPSSGQLSPPQGNHNDRLILSDTVFVSKILENIKKIEERVKNYKEYNEANKA